MFPLTRPQKQVYDMERFYDAAIAQLCGGILLDGLVPEETLASAADALRRVNDALRLRVAGTRTGPMQEAVPYVPARPETVRFASRGELEAWAAAWTREPLDPDRVRCDMRLAFLPDRCGVLVKLDHMLGDEWSYLLLASQLCDLLRGTEPESGSYQAYAASEEAYFRGRGPERDRVYVLEQFRGREEPVYVSRRPDGPPDSAQASFFLDGEQTALIRARAAEWGVSPYILFLTAFAVIVSRLNGNAERFYLGADVRNRRSAAEKRTAGMFVNTTALPVTLDYGQSFRENAALMRTGVTSMLLHQRCNYGQARQVLRQAFGFKRKLFDAELSYQNGAVRGGGGAETIWADGGQQFQALILRVSDHDNRGAFCLNYGYQTAKFTAGEIAALHQCVSGLLFDGLAHGEKRLGELTIQAPSGGTGGRQLWDLRG